MDMSIQLRTRAGPICTLSLSFNNDGPLGTFFRYICDNGTYIARYDDLVTGKEEPIDVSHGRRLHERHRAAGPGVHRGDPRGARAQLQRRATCCPATGCSASSRRSSRGSGSRRMAQPLTPRRPGRSRLPGGGQRINSGRGQCISSRAAASMSCSESSTASAASPSGTKLSSAGHPLHPAAEAAIGEDAEHPSDTPADAPGLVRHQDPPGRPRLAQDVLRRQRRQPAQVHHPAPDALRREPGRRPQAQPQPVAERHDGQVGAVPVGPGAGPTGTCPGAQPSGGS